MQRGGRAAEGNGLLNRSVIFLTPNPASFPFISHRQTETPRANCPQIRNPGTTCNRFNLTKFPTMKVEPSINPKHDPAEIDPTIFLLDAQGPNGSHGIVCGGARVDKPRSLPKIRKPHEDVLV